MATKQKLAKVLSAYELMSMFPSEEVAIEYLTKILWPNGPVCPFCGSARHYTRNTSKQLFCSDCRKSYTIKTNTIFHNSQIPLHKWLYAMYLIVTARKGISSLQLSKEIGIIQKSAWFMEQRIRAACGNKLKKMLSGIIESDEVHIGGLEKNKHEWKKQHLGRGAVGKTHVMGMKDRDGQVIAQVVANTDKDTLQGIINENVVAGSTVCTDESSSYVGLNENYNHKTVNHSAKQYVDGMAHTNGIESVWAVLKRGFYGTFHSFSEKHCQRYLDEFTFRLNEGNCNIDTVDRLGSLVKGTGKRVSYKVVVSGVYNSMHCKKHFQKLLHRYIPRPLENSGNHPA